MTEILIQSRCEKCNEDTVFKTDKKGHGVHFLLMIFTLGVWIPVWIMHSLLPERAKCVKCGEVAPLTPVEKKKAGLGLQIFFGFIGAMMMGFIILVVKM